MTKNKESKVHPKNDHQTTSPSVEIDSKGSSQPSNSIPRKLKVQSTSLWWSSFELKFL